MCGIYGVVGEGHSSEIVKRFLRLGKNLERRGQDASGVIYVDAGGTIETVKAPSKFSELSRTLDFKRIQKKIELVPGFSGVLVGHNRLATNGSTSDPANNQPASLGSWVCVQNGIVTNDLKIKQRLTEEGIRVEHQDLDTFSLLGLLEKYSRSHDSFDASYVLSFLASEIYGANTFFAYSDRFRVSLVFSNNGSLFYKQDGGQVVFSSEREMLGEGEESKQLIFPAVLVFDHKKNTFIELICPERRTPEQAFHAKATTCLSGITKKSPHGVVHGSRYRLEKILFDCFDRSQISVSSLKACARCGLPGSFPGITFNKADVCSLCANYKKLNLQGTEVEFVEKVDRLRNNKDVLVSLSGGRDSCFLLHKMRSYGFNVRAFTYDWGMVTDLARRNQARLCGKLGVEHILVAADLKKKRRNIRMNVSAWLKKPNLGLIPLFMAGDKHYFYYAEKIKKENNLSLNVMGENQLEKTIFKSKFAGVDQSSRKGEMAYDVTNSEKLRLLSYYYTQFANNIDYFNSSIFDTASGFVSYYFLKKNYLNIFDYVAWNESLVEDTLKLYDWEYSHDCSTSWRIGDGTAPFYNFIYHHFVGFTEHNTLRANQVREGHLSLSEAKKLVDRDNFPRTDSFKWYCDVIGLDAVEVATRISETKSFV